MVAKSYESLELIGEPYEINKRWYIKVRQKNNTEKQVRWYSDKEYARMYGETPNHDNDPFYKTQKEVLGFKEGYITIFKGNTYEVKDELKSAGARYTRLWGWGIPGGEEVPALEGIEPIKLDWTVVGNEDESLKTDEEVQKVIESLMYEPSSSTFQGEIGERLRDILVKVVKSFQISG